MRRRVSAESIEEFGFPTAKKFPYAKTYRHRPPKQHGVFIHHGNTYVRVGAEPSLLAYSEVSYYSKRVADIARRWISKSSGNQVVVRLSTVLASTEHGIATDTADVQVVKYPRDDAFAAVGPNWEWRKWFSGPGISQQGHVPREGLVTLARQFTRNMLLEAAQTEGWSDDTIYYRGVFVVDIEVQLWAVRKP